MNIRRLVLYIIAAVGAGGCVAGAFTEIGMAAGGVTLVGSVCGFLGGLGTGMYR